jgi:hypothetical protein
MAGRPKTMYRRIQRLLERFYVLHEDFEQRMPQKYAEPTGDPLGECWRTTSKALYAAEYGLEELDYMLYQRVQRATEATLREAIDERAELAESEAEDDTDGDAAMEPVQVAMPVSGTSDTPETPES